MENLGVDHLPLVLITGITGYIAQQVAHQLLQTGEYRIRGTVRDLKRQQLIIPLTKMHKNFESHVELKQIQLNSQHWPQVMQGVDFVLHIASPVETTVSVKKGQQRIIQASKIGTQLILEAAVNEKGCKGFIATSSIIAMINGRLKPGMNFITEENWSLDTKGYAYDQSKLQQERIIQNFMRKTISDDRRNTFKYCTINPGLVWGPSRGSRLNESIQWIQKIMLNKFPGIPNVTVPYCDVRDVARVHIQAMKQIDQVDSRRIIVVESCPKFKEVVVYLRRVYERFKYKLPKRDISYCLVSIAAWCSTEAKYIKGFWNKQMSFDDSARKQLGIDQMIPCQQSAVQTADWLIKNDFLPNKIGEENDRA